MKDEIEGLLLRTERSGIEDVCRRLEASGFYTSPASSRHHLNREGGLAEHSLNVRRLMKEWNRLYGLGLDEDSLVLVGLLHDVCKSGLYKPNILKNGRVSEAKPYVIDDSLPVGHGEKSVIRLLSWGLELRPDEIVGIRWHMGPFDDVSVSRCQGGWNGLSKLCFMADYFSTTFMEE